ncbi:hypothetical protein XENTR_v10002623 [Xenopus tropicalis]|nr:hypothetical protein XENTR_v10002623 [Xenopus tropicalis]
MYILSLGEMKTGYFKIVVKRWYYAKKRLCFPIVMQNVTFSLPKICFSEVMFLNCMERAYYIATLENRDFCNCDVIYERIQILTAE